MKAHHIILAMSTLTITACPKPQPEPEPAGCKGDQTACVDQPHTDGPPPIGSNSPPPR